MQFIKIKVFAAVFTFCLFYQIAAFGQLTQTYKNGFVAATNNGLYYLQDGSDKWVKFDSQFKFMDDSISSVSFSGDRLFVSTYNLYPLS